MIRVVLDLLVLALIVYCLIDCIQTPDAEVRGLPKWAWIVLVVLLPLVGSIAWLVAGRPPRGEGAPRRVPWPAGRSGYPTAARGPDDDPDFLHDLSSGLRTGSVPDDDALREWEEDLRRDAAPVPPSNDAEQDVAPQADERKADERKGDERKADERKDGEEPPPLPA